MNRYHEAADRLVDFREFLVDVDIEVPKSKFTGSIGEWRAIGELVDRGHKPVPTSSQKPSDIHLPSPPYPDFTKLEVKTGAFGTAAFDGCWSFDNISPDKFDCLLCVKVPRDYSSTEYFIFTAEEVRELFPYRTPNDSNDTRRFRLVVNRDNLTKPKEVELNERFEDFKNTWDKLPSPE